MKKQEVKVGMQVVVNKLVETPIYTIKDISENGFICQLEYESCGKTLNGGLMDVSCLIKPTQKQLDYHNQ